MQILYNSKRTDTTKIMSNFNGLMAYKLPFAKNPIFAHL